MNKRISSIAVVLLCALAVILSGCRVNISVGTNDTLTGETYPDAEKYQTGAFTYNATDIKAVEVYWRSGEVEITESDHSELHVQESGSELPEDIAMHYFLDDGVLRIRFCKSDTKIHVNPADKRLRIEVPKGIELSVHTTSADIKADTLEQTGILISAHSGKTELGTIMADHVDLSSSAGSIGAAQVTARSLQCSASSGAVDLGTVSVKALDCSTTSGAVTVGSLRAKTAQITASSGAVDLTLTEVPTLQIQTSSGNVDLALAKGGAEVLHTASSGRLLTDCTYERKGDLYVFGSGAGNITVETSSGNLKIQ